MSPSARRPLLEEDSLERYYPVRDPAGAFAGIARTRSLPSLRGRLRGRRAGHLRARERLGGNAIEGVINAQGYAFVRAGEPESGLTLFELNTLVFPRSSNAWDSLAEAHMTLGHEAEAREIYQTSLELNADNANARAKLELLGEAAEPGGK